MNQVIVVGRACSEIKIEDVGETKKAYLSLAINRPYKNSEGVYETDFIRCVLWGKVANNANEYVRKGDVVGVKGCLQTRSYEDKEGNKKFVMEVVGEKVTFLSSNKKDSTESATEECNKNVTKCNKTEEDPFQNFSDEVEISADDLPF